MLSEDNPSRTVQGNNFRKKKEELHQNSQDSVASAPAGGSPAGLDRPLDQVARSRAEARWRVGICSLESEPEASARRRGNGQVVSQRPSSSTLNCPLCVICERRNGISFMAERGWVGLMIASYPGGSCTKTLILLSLGSK